MKLLNEAWTTLQEADGPVRVIFNEDKVALKEAPSGGKTLNLRRNGFVIAPEEDFSDDGNRFKGYYYDPDHTGDKRFVTSKLISDGNAYIDVHYYDEEKGRNVYFDDLNGVDYQYAIDHIKDLTDKLDAYKAKLDAGELKARELSDEEIQNIKDKVKQLIELSDMNWSEALNVIYKKLNINSDDLKKELRDKIYKELESEIRNSKQDNPVAVKIIAKKALEQVLKGIQGSPGGYDYRGKYKEGRKPQSLEDALRDVRHVFVYISNYPGEKEKEDVAALKQQGYTQGSSVGFSDLTDATQEKIKNWIRRKVEILQSEYEDEQD